MKKYIWLAMTAVFCCAGITGCSNDDPAIPLPPRHWKRVKRMKSH